MATDWPESRALMLAAILPSGTDVWIALFNGNPITGGTEITLTGYARVAHQNWTTADLGGASERKNSTDIVFPTITQAGTADYWGIYDASVGGILLRSDAVLDAIGQPFTINFTGVGEEARFLTNALRIKLMET